MIENRQIPDEQTLRQEVQAWVDNYNTRVDALCRLPMQNDQALDYRESLPERMNRIPMTRKGPPAISTAKPLL